MKISELIHHLSRKGLAANTARSSFHNYLKNLCDEEDSFSIDTLDSFYDRAMSFHYWQENKQELGQTLMADLKQIDGAQVEGALHGHEIQWLQIEQSRDFDELIASENQILKKRSEDIRTLPLDKGRLLRIRRASDHGIRVEVKNRLGFIEGSRLHLARPESQLLYTRELELKENTHQVIQLSPLKIARFQIQNEIVRGYIVQGTGFVKTEAISGHLEDNPEVFFNLKRIEKLFINPHTDPYYMGLVSQLEKAIQLARSQHPDSATISHEILRKAETFAREAFTDDKRLTELISTLKYSTRREDGLNLNQQSRSQVDLCQQQIPRIPRPEKFV